MKLKHLNMFLDMAEVAAKTSTAVRLKVGALIVKDSRILSIGINGTAPGTDNCCEEVVDGVLITKLTVAHAEVQAIYKAARDGQPIKDSTLFCTHAPCLNCSIAILNTGIKEVYYRKSYRNTDGIHFLNQNGTDVRCI